MKWNVSSKRKKALRTAGIIIVVLIIIRLILPYVVLHYVNKSLASMEGYYGHVNDVDLSLYRGAYKIKDIYINKVDKQEKQVPFFSAQLIDLSVEWKALLHGSLAGESDLRTMPTQLHRQSSIEGAFYPDSSSKARSDMGFCTH